MLLRPQADSPSIVGRLLDIEIAGTHLDFRYRVIRLWQQQAEPLLEGGSGVLPLAPISNVREEDLPQLISRMAQRLAANPDGSDVQNTWTATLILLGLRYPPAVGQTLLRGVRNMKESSTYQAILSEGEAEGRLKEARSLLLRVGTRRFGHPPPHIAIEIESIADLGKLELLHERIVDAASWESLLSQPS